MSEYYIGFQAIGGLVGVVVACVLYMIGGRSNKIIRRIGSAFILAVTVNVLCAVRGIWSPYQLIVFPALFGGFSMGYGADSTGMKIIRRLLYAVAICTSGVILALTIGGNAWMILPLHIGVGLWTVWLGVKNPIQAAAEEVFVCALLNIGLVMYPFV